MTSLHNRAAGKRFPYFPFSVGRLGLGFLGTLGRFLGRLVLRFSPPLTASIRHMPSVYDRVISAEIVHTVWAECRRESHSHGERCHPSRQGGRAVRPSLPYSFRWDEELTKGSFRPTLSHMKTICFANQKGGVGKTSLAGNVAWLAAKSRPTLIVDGDPQGSVSSWLSADPLTFELADVLQERAGLKDAVRQLAPNLSLLGTFGVGGELKSFAERSLENWPRCFEDLKEAATGLGYQFIVFDVSPGLGRLERMIMLASDEVVLPLTPEYFSIDGLEIFKTFLDETRKRNRVEIRFEKVILNMVNRSFKRHVAYRERVRASGFTVFEIPQDSSIPSAQILQKPLATYDPQAKSLPELGRLTEALVQEAVYA